MSIYKTVQKDKLTPGADRALLSLIMGEICVDGKPMDDTAAIKRLSQMSKVCSKNIELYTNAKKTDMAIAERSFRNMVESYMPKGADELDIESAIVELGVERSTKSMGKVMGLLKERFPVVDGNLVRMALLGDSK